MVWEWLLTLFVYVSTLLWDYLLMYTFLVSLEMELHQKINNKQLENNCKPIRWECITLQLNSKISSSPLTFSNMQTHFEINELEKLVGLWLMINCILLLFYINYINNLKSTQDSQSIARNQIKENMRSSSNLYLSLSNMKAKQ